MRPSRAPGGLVLVVTTLAGVLALAGCGDDEAADADAALVDAARLDVARLDAASRDAQPESPMLIVTPSFVELDYAGLPFGTPPFRTVKVELSQAPPADVVIDVRTSDSVVATARPATLRFTTRDFAVAQIVTITGHLEDDDLAREFIQLRLQAPWGLTQIGITHADNSEQGLWVTPATLTLGEGQSGSFQARLSSRPSSTVTISFASSNPAVVSVPPSYPYTPAFYPGQAPIMVTAPEDADSLPGSADITVSSPGLDLRVVHVNVTDND